MAKILKLIKYFLRYIDVFGVSYAFKYKDKEKYTTSIRGLFVLLFFAAALFMGIYYFIPFYNRKNYTTVYYTLKMSQTEKVNFKKAETSFALGLNCPNGSDGTNPKDLFRMEQRFVLYKLEEKYNKYIYSVNTHKCTKADFYNRHNETFDGSSLGNYQCLEHISNDLEGIYTSPIFTYYEFDVYAKNNSEILLDKISKYLTENDCKLQMYFSDYTIDINDYNNPIKSYIEAVFIQLNPTLSIRRNIFFMNQYLYDDNYLFWVYNDDNEAKYIKTLFSRYEEYSLFQDLKRTNKSSDYLNYVRVYIRADNKKTDVQRKYQKIMEFYADASSLLIALYEILIIIFNYINNFWAEQSLSKKIFFFKDLKQNGLNIKQRLSQINELLEITGTDSIIDKKDINFKMNQNLDGSSKKDMDIIDYINNDGIRVYSTNRKNKIYQNKKNANKKIYLNQRTKISRKRFDEGLNINHDRLSNIFKGRESNSSVNFKSNSNINIKENNDKQNNKNEYGNNNFYENKSNKIFNEEIKTENITYDFNICEILGLTFCKCWQTQTLQIKNDLNEKANSILSSKLDIVLYIRNMLLFDIMNETFLGTGIKDIINFLSRPIISLNQKEKNELALFYHNYNPSDFDKFYDEVNVMSKKPVKRIEEKELISLVNKHLKRLTV